MAMKSNFPKSSYSGGKKKQRKIKARKGSMITKLKKINPPQSATIKWPL